MRETTITLAGMRERNSEAGEFFFSPEAMNFFRTRLSRRAYEVRGFLFFVYSDLHPEYGRVYRAAVMTPGGSVIRSDDRYLPTLTRARTAARNAARRFEKDTGEEDLIRAELIERRSKATTLDIAAEPSWSV